MEMYAAASIREHQQHQQQLLLQQLQRQQQQQQQQHDALLDRAVKKLSFQLVNCDLLSTATETDGEGERGERTAQGDLEAVEVASESGTEKGVQVKIILTFC